MDQLIIGDKASFDDFVASIATRKIKMPKKKSIKETVPFSNITYDFSAINGETYWEERELEYGFEIIADDPETLEELKSSFSAWVMGVANHKLHDPFIPDYHFLATYSDMKQDDDEGLDKCTLTVTFTAYPYKIANTPKVYARVYAPSERWIIDVLNESDHPVSLTIANTVEIGVAIDSGGVTSIVTIPAGNGTYSALKLPKGQQSIAVSNNEAKEGTVSIIFSEEVI